MNIKRLILYTTIILIPIAALLGYILFVTSTATDWKTNLGAFGDSFGVVNTLFTGLTFSGLIINLLQQREEIKIQKEDLLESRKQFSRSADAQEKTARLAAFFDLLKEYNERIETLSTKISDNEKLRNANRPSGEHYLREALKNQPPYKHPMADKLEELKDKKNKILEEFEKSLLDSRVKAS
ncbi:MAG TPA: hypothetical protein VIE65_01830 [Methylobacter sp.]